MQLNEQELRRECREGGVHEGRVYPGAHMLNTPEIHVAPGAVIKPGAVLDAESGPIHVDRDVLIQPNAVIEGPCFIGAGSIIRPAKSRAASFRATPTSSTTASLATATFARGSIWGLTRSPAT